MRPFRLVPLIAIAVLAAACAGGGATPAPATATPAPATATPAPATATPAPAATAPAASAEATAAATRIEVRLTDALRIEPASMTVPAGIPVTFVVTNEGSILHEFVLGDEADQAAHEEEMAAGGGMSMPEDEEMAIGVEPGKTKELTVTFGQAGTILAGCHVIGHYPAGMKATVTIQ